MSVSGDATARRSRGGRANGRAIDEDDENARVARARTRGAGRAGRARWGGHHIETRVEVPTR